MMLGHFIPRNHEPIVKEFVQPDASPSFIYWLFKYRCVECKRPATEINEIIPRSRWINAADEWRNRVPLCRVCHEKYHHDGVTDLKIQALKLKRNEFLIAMGREDYL